MTPKKKTKGSKATKNSSTIIDGVSMQEMSREQLEGFVVRIQHELEREREERNYYQLERNKLHTFWGVTRQQLEECKAGVRNKDRDLEDLEKKHQEEIKTYQRKMKHLTNEQHARLIELKAINMMELIERDKKANLTERQLNEELNKAQLLMEEQRETYFHQLRGVALEHENQLRELCAKFERQYEKFQTETDNNWEKIIIEGNDRNNEEVKLLEHIKTEHINNVIANHKISYQELLKHFKMVSNTNNALVEDLKDKLTKMEKNSIDRDMRYERILRKNAALILPLKEAQERMSQMNHQLTNQQVNKRALQASEKLLQFTKNKYDQLKIQCYELQLELDQVKKSHHELENQLSNKISELSAKSTSCILEAERRSTENEKITSQIREKILDLLAFLSADKSYDLYENLEECLQKIVESVRELLEIINRKNKKNV